MAALLYWLIAANAVAFILMVWDKAQAERAGQRISEQTLILWSMAGGSVGALAAQRLARHKTRKQPIAGILTVMPLIHGGLAALWLGGAGDALAATLFGA